MPVVPFTKPQSKAPQLPEVDDTYLAIAAAGMHEMNRLFENKDNLGPVYHPPGWIGNRNYKEHFEGADKAIEIENRTGKAPSIRTPTAPRIIVPPYRGPNKIA